MAKFSPGEFVVLKDKFVDHSHKERFYDLYGMKFNPNKRPPASGKAYQVLQTIVIGLSDVVFVSNRDGDVHLINEKDFELYKPKSKGDTDGDAMSASPTPSPSGSIPLIPPSPIPGSFVVGMHELASNITVDPVHQDEIVDKIKDLVESLIDDYTE